MGVRLEFAEKTETDASNPFIPKIEAFLKEKCIKDIQRLVENYPQKRSLPIDFKDIELFDFELADELLINPDYVLEAAKEAIKNIDVPALELEDFSPHIRVFNLPKEQQPLLRNISASHLGKLISVEGVVGQLTEVMPKLKMATWECTRCGNTYKIPQSDHQSKPPYICECKHRSFNLVSEESEFVDYQKIKTQEPLEMLKGNEQAATLDIYVSDDLVNQVSPGDRTRISGILRLIPPKDKKTIYGRYLEALHIEETMQEFEDIEITPEDEKLIRELAAKPDIYELLVKSIAQTIYGHEMIKEAIALQLFGGVRKVLPGDNKLRGNIHILLVGDPGLAKCVDGSTKLLLEDGTSKEIKDLVEESLEGERQKLDDGFFSNTFKRLPILNGDCELERGVAVRAMKRRPDRMFFVKTSTGKEIKATHTHPLFASVGGKVKAVKTMDLKKGDFIAIPRTVTVKGAVQKLDTKITLGKTNARHILTPEVLDEKLARVVGYMLAEGHINKKHSTVALEFTNSDKEVVDDFVECAEELFGIKHCRDFKSNATRIMFSSVELGEFIEKNFVELSRLSRQRTIPNSIMSSPDSVVKEFLKVFIETEGSVRNDCRFIEISSASEELIDGLIILLSRFEIVSVKKEIWNMATNTTKKIKRKYFKLTIGGKFAKKYVKTVGFISGRKIKKAKEKILNSKLFNTNNDVVPNLNKELKFLRKKIGLTQFEMGVARTSYRHYERGDRNPSREQLLLIANRLIEAYFNRNLFDKEIEEKALNLYKLSKTSIFWDKVREVKEIEPADWVYDLEVAGTHNFISNMVFSHNSQLLMAVDKIAPKSIYIAGKTSSGAGISATAVKDDFGEGGWTLKAGALVLANGGICLIDELDKMDAEDRSALHESLEQQRISVAKAGIVTTFKTETSVLAAANPKFSRFDQFMSFIEQINLPPTLISRFDLFFMLKDVLDRKKDEDIARHILKTHQIGEKMWLEKKMKKKMSAEDRKELEKSITPAIDADLFKKYLSFARQNIFPVLTQESIQALSDFYISLRDQGRKEGSYAATHRQLEGLVRLSEASARVRLSNTVEIRDAERAIRLVKTSLQEVVTDPETGKIDIDIITSGQTHTQITNLKKILRMIRSKSTEIDDGMVPIEDIVEESKTEGIDSEKVREILSKLEKSGDIYRPRHGVVKPTAKQ
ncbi:MAG: LAGLIDADG family homing endonuclease [Candidatus Diapherotrites archaeon]